MFRSKVNRVAQRSVLLLAAIALTVCLAFWGCGSSDSGAGSSGHAGGTIESFTFAFPFNPTSLDATQDVTGVDIEASVNDTLELSGAANALTPQLATSVTTPTPTTIVYHLRHGVRFSNGDPLTAADVAWSINRAFAPSSQVSTYLSGFKSAEVSGADTVTMHLTKPNAAARGSMAFAVYVQNKKYASEHPDNFGSASAPPIGTGPYKVAKWGTDGVTLTRNPYYWGPKPPADTLKFAFIEEDTTAINAMRSGEIQGTWTINDARTVPQWTAIPDTTLYEALGAQSIFLSVDMTKAPYKDLHVRRAIAYGIDRQGLLDAAFKGKASLLKGIFAAPGFQDVAPSEAAAEELLDGLPQYPFDLTKAKDELAKSGYADGFTMNLPYLAGKAWAELSALSIQETLGKIGIKVIPKPLPSAQYYAQALGGVHRQPQLVQFATYPEDPNGGLAFLVGKENAIEYGSNYANYYSPKVDHAWRQVTGSLNKSVRWEGVQTLLKGIATELPYVAMFNEPQLVVLGDGLTFKEPLYYTDLVNGQWAFKLQ